MALEEGSSQSKLCGSTTIMFYLYSYGDHFTIRRVHYDNKNTVEPLYNGHIGAGQFVRYKEVSFIGRLVQECICNPYYHVMKYYMIHVHVHS